MRKLAFYHALAVRFIPLVFAMGWSGCSREGAGCGTPLGETASDVISLELSPDQLVVRDRIEVHWWPSDSVPRIVRHAWEGTIEGISVIEDGGVIYIEDLNRCGWSRRMDAVPRIDLWGIAPPQVVLESQADFVMEAPWTEGNLTVEGDEMAGNLNIQFHQTAVQISN